MSNSNRVTTWLMKYGVLVGLFILLFGFAFVRPNILLPLNITTIFAAASISFIMFAGVTWIFSIGEVDVSFTNIAALSNVVTAWSVQQGMGWGTAILAGLMVGVVFGILNGVLVGYLRLSSLVTTIATGGLTLSIAKAIGAGASFRIDDTGFMGDLVNASFGIFPVTMLLALLIAFVLWVCQEKLLLGHYIYAQESNYKAVHEAGIPVKKLNVYLFLFAGVMAALSGCFIAASLSSGQPGIGNSYFIDGLTAIFLGSLAFRQGKANVLGTLIGVLILTVLTNGAGLSGWANYERDMVKGGLLLLGVFVLIRGGRIHALKPKEKQPYEADKSVLSSK
ncbi:ABC transporter permease [Vibrio penaeicida]|uniref:Ribose ABC transporter permease n=1 Tax=Vibrio penaeicida TaxID=104609 RepID=A0AAV5NMG5_9VIBR|nr:ABC transporter permease [Vibrio penaeicida]GLQ71539.1 ribose ABC transporter permease [Vibrio penaeicida]